MCQKESPHAYSGPLVQRLRDSSASSVSDSRSAYHDCKHLASDVLLLLLSRLPASFIPMVLSYKLVQCLTNILSTKDIWLHKVAQYFLKELSDWVR